MATFKGDNVTLIENGGKVNMVDAGVVVRFIKDRVSINGNLDAGDVIQLGSKIPSGAKVLQIATFIGNMGSTVFNAGYESELGYDADYDYFVPGDQVTGYDGTFTGMAKAIHLVNAQPIERDLQLAFQVTTGEVGVVNGSFESWIFYVD